MQVPCVAWGAPVGLPLCTAPPPAATKGRCCQPLQLSAEGALLSGRASRAVCKACCEVLLACGRGESEGKPENNQTIKIFREACDRGFRRQAAHAGARTHSSNQTGRAAACDLVHTSNRALWLPSLTHQAPHQGRVRVVAGVQPQLAGGAAGIRAEEAARTAGAGGRGEHVGAAGGACHKACQSSGAQ